MTNLQQPRPEAWQNRPLFAFIEDGWNNVLAAVHNKNVVAARLANIDTIFEDAHKITAPADIAHLLPAFLFMRSFTSFRASIMMGLCLPTDSYALQRSCLENAGYARLISDDHTLSETWLTRDDSETTRKLIRATFTHAKIRSSIATKDAGLSEVYQSLYERCIDFGAHPNEKAVTLNVVKASLRTSNIQFRLLPGDGPALDHAVRTAAQVGICALRIFSTIFEKQFDKHGLPARISHASLGF